MYRISHAAADAAIISASVEDRDVLALRLVEARDGRRALVHLAADGLAVRHQLLPRGPRRPQARLRLGVVEVARVLMAPLPGRQPLDAASRGFGRVGTRARRRCRSGRRGRAAATAAGAAVAPLHQEAHPLELLDDRLPIA